MLHALSSLRTLGVLSVLLALVACGGSTSTDDGVLGTFGVIALEGEPLPGPTVGSVGALPTGGVGGDPIMAMAGGGWSVAVVPTTNGATPFVVLVLAPGGTQVEVLRAGQALPGLVDGTIASVLRVWITAAGRVTALVTITGNSAGKSFGVVSVPVSGGVAGTVERVIYDLDSLAPASLAGTLVDLDDGSITVDDASRVWFIGLTNFGDLVLFSAPTNGSALVAHARPGDALPGGVTVLDLVTFGVSPLGTRFAFVATASDGDDRLVTGAPGVVAFDRIAGEGDALTGGGNLAVVWSDGPLIVYGANTVVWRGTGSLSANDHVIQVGSPVARQVLARRGTTAGLTGGGTYGNIRLVQQSSEQVFPYFSCDVVGASNGITFAIYGITSTAQPPDLALYNGRGLVNPDSTAMGATFPSLDRPPLITSARNATLGVANVISDGRSGVFWLLPTEGLATVAVSGDPTPAGETWAPFSPTAFVTMSTDGIQWLGRLAASGRDGLFRRVR